jgi:hypothetical protein
VPAIGDSSPSDAPGLASRDARGLRDRCSGERLEARKPVDVLSRVTPFGQNPRRFRRIQMNAGIGWNPRSVVLAGRSAYWERAALCSVLNSLGRDSKAADALYGQGYGSGSRCQDPDRGSIVRECGNWIIRPSLSARTLWPCTGRRLTIIFRRLSDWIGEVDLRSRRVSPEIRFGNKWHFKFIR